MLRIAGIKLSIDEDPSLLQTKILRKLRVGKKDLLNYQIYKQSIDARKPGKIYFVYTVDVNLRNQDQVLAKCISDSSVSLTPDLEYTCPPTGTRELSARPVIIGGGPAGLFAGLLLSQLGYRPLLLERGPDIDTRAEKVDRFWKTGLLDPEGNVQFGEGGAGSFSDGKLTTLIRDKRCRKVLEEFIRAGAPAEILYTYKPHVGTDILRQVVKNIRQTIINQGGEVRFNNKVTDFIITGHRLIGVTINDIENLAAEVVILAIGHSARDTFARLLERGVHLRPKPFSIGLRIEHPQQLINQVQFKEFANHPRLGAADYKLSYHSPTGRSAYTFCMCPGGFVVAAASEKGGVVTNGMSNYAREAETANSALLVGVKPEDFGGSHPLAGVEFQRRWEKLAFELGGRTYRAPAQLVGDFLVDRPSTQLSRVKPTYRPSVTLAELKHCLPEYVTQTLKEAILNFDRKLPGFALPEAVLTGVETRSSSPVRIERDATFQSNIAGLYPAGEGAGYAGGIISAAVDGLKIAEAIVAQYRPFDAR
ncbi:MAG: hypothetical protein GX755_03105 [Syntrophomonadaceae bacterium]|nr:hypothetical protein [Syntrophomonadaceae bacterium]